MGRYLLSPNFPFRSPDALSITVLAELQRVLHFFCVWDKCPLSLYGVRWTEWVCRVSKQVAVTSHYTLNGQLWNTLNVHGSQSTGVHIQEHHLWRTHAQSVYTQVCCLRNHFIQCSQIKTVGKSPEAFLVCQRPNGAWSVWLRVSKVKSSY